MKFICPALNVAFRNIYSGDAQLVIEDESIYSREGGEGLKSLQQTYAAQIAKTRKDAFTLRLNQALRFVPEITKRALEYAKYPGSSNWLTAGASEELHHHLSASEFRDGIATRYGFEPPDMPAL
ncbi:hypothetical protein GJ496_008945, partial [Pomphorhynchus laevis]